ncbi:MAG: BrnT family toxin [Bdellovibrionales bacterium]|nr:BrnT family toxin [Bdellovibrionales bacterium]
MRIESFDWDNGNLEKLKKHKVSVEIIEDFLTNYEVNCFADYKHSIVELRFIAFGKYKDRDLLVVFTFRANFSVLQIRVISARYVHKKELRKLYEEIKNKKENCN